MDFSKKTSFGLKKNNQKTEFLLQKVLQFYWIPTMFKHVLCSVLIERVRFLTLLFSRAPLFISASRISDSLELLLDLHSSERHESLLTSNFRGGNPLYFAKQEEGPVLLV